MLKGNLQIAQQGKCFWIKHKSINLMRSPIVNVRKGESISTFKFLGVHKHNIIYIYGHQHRSLYPAHAASAG